MNRRHGFTLIELFIVIGIIAIISVFSLNLLFQRRGTTDLNDTTQQITTLLREAQSRATAQSGNSSWGVHFGNATTTAPFYALFSSPYSTATIVGYYRMPTDVCYATATIPQGSSLEVIFNAISGAPSSSASIPLRLIYSSNCAGTAVSSATVSVSSQGLISF